jgi:hypothetical protein
MKQEKECRFFLVGFFWGNRASKIAAHYKQVSHCGIFLSAISQTIFNQNCPILNNNPIVAIAQNNNLAKHSAGFISFSFSNKALFLGYH